MTFQFPLPHCFGPQNWHSKYSSSSMMGWNPIGSVSGPAHTIYLLSSKGEARRHTEITHTRTARSLQTLLESPRGPCIVNPWAKPRIHKPDFSWTSQVPRVLKLSTDNSLHVRSVNSNSGFWCEHDRINHMQWVLENDVVVLTCKDCGLGSSLWW
jgi:hypothetical protein